MGNNIWKLLDYLWVVIVNGDYLIFREVEIWNMVWIWLFFYLIVINLSFRLIRFFIDFI